MHLFSLEFTLQLSRSEPVGTAPTRHRRHVYDIFDSVLFIRSCYVCLSRFSQFYLEISRF